MRRPIPSDSILALVCGYASTYAENKLLVMLHAFIDDSTSDMGDQRLFLAGYVNTASRWASFSDAWDAELKAHPSISYFKMSEAQSLRGQFEGWMEVDRDAKVNRLAKIVEAHTPWSIECSVSRIDNNRIMCPVAPYGLGNPYFSCFYGIVIILAKFHKQQGITLPVDFIFDEQGALGNEAIMFYEYIKSQQPDEWRDLLGSTPIFRDDKKVLPLQAADMLAWHVRRKHEKREDDRSLGALDMLLGDGRHVMATLQAENLQSMADKMRELPNVHLTRDKKTWKQIKALIAGGAGPPDRGNAPESLFHRLSALIRAKLSRFRFKAF